MCLCLHSLCSYLSVGCFYSQCWNHENLVFTVYPLTEIFVLLLGNAKAAASGLETSTKNKETADMLGKSHSVWL